ncbi:hypothetical protein GCM10028777_02250 [Angustibacter speluncae]
MMRSVGMDRAHHEAIAEEQQRLQDAVAHTVHARGTGRAHALRFVMCIAVMTMARHIPPPLRPALLRGCARWYADVEDADSLESDRVLCWHYLDAKNGNSTTINDATDVAVRVLIGVLWDECDEEDVDHFDMGFDFFAGLLARYRELDTQVRLI